MAIYNTLNWQNEHSLSNFPLSSYIEFRDFLVDAKFVQFNNFIPILNTISVDETDIKLSITFDYGVDNNIVLSKQKFLQNPNNTNIRIYTPSNNRYLGVLVFGPGTMELFKKHTGRTLTLNMPFSSDSVRSIPKSDAVYTFDGLYGDVTLGRGISDDCVFYNTSASKKTIVFNAVKNHEIRNSLTKQGLRKINSVPPINNNINLSPSEIIRVTPNNGTSLLISLVSGNVDETFQISKV